MRTRPPPLPRPRRRPPLRWLLVCCASLWACAAPAGGDTPAPAAQPPRPAAAALQPVKALGEPGQRSFQLLFSPDGSRFARSSQAGVELWQLQPLRRLGAAANLRQPPNPGSGLRFDTDGWLHYVVDATHAWLTPDLREGRGVDKVAGLSADGRYALRSGSVGAGGIGRDGRLAGAGLPQLYPLARNDAYDLRAHRSACQLPPTAPAGRLAVGGSWLAIQEAAAGPSNPRPLVVCDLAGGQAYLLLSGKAGLLSAAIDPLGRWMAVTASSSDAVQARLYPLPLRPEEFAVDPHRTGCEAGLPCGEPRPLPTADAPPAHAQPSPDGRWLVGFLDHPPRAVFFDTAALKTAATLEIAPANAGGRRLAFSANGRWLALQAGDRLYRADLAVNPPGLLDVQPAAAAAAVELQDIHNDGVHWLLRDAGATPSGKPAGGLWRLDQP